MKPLALITTILLTQGCNHNRPHMTLRPNDQRWQIKATLTYKPKEIDGLETRLELTTPNWTDKLTPPPTPQQPKDKPKLTAIKPKEDKK